jgi:predicted methyltransferase
MIRTLAALLLAAASPAFAQDEKPARPAEDVARDDARRPTEMVAFAQIKPGASVADLIAGNGYFTRVFAIATGPTGKVVAIVPPASAKANPAAAKAMDALAKDPSFGNVSVVQELSAAGAPGSLDVLWTAQNYHDLYNFLPPEGIVAFNKGAFAMLKPGGVFVVVDHAASAGSGKAATNSLHRIDPAQVKADVTAAGFVFDGETTVLANAADDHIKNVFDPAIRGKTDQFAYRFRKP